MCAKKYDTHVKLEFLGKSLTYLYDFRLRVNANKRKIYMRLRQMAADLYQYLYFSHPQNKSTESNKVFNTMWISYLSNVWTVFVYIHGAPAFIDVDVLAIGLTMGWWEKKNEYAGRESVHRKKKTYDVAFMVCWKSPTWLVFPILFDMTVFVLTCG